MTILPWTTSTFPMCSFFFSLFFFSQTTTFLIPSLDSWSPVISLSSPQINSTFSSSSHDKVWRSWWHIIIFSFVHFHSESSIRKKTCWHGFIGMFRVYRQVAGNGLMQPIPRSLGKASSTAVLEPRDWVCQDLTIQFCNVPQVFGPHCFYPHGKQWLCWFYRTMAVKDNP